MKIENMLRRNKSAFAIATVVLVVLLPVGYYAIRDAFPRSAEPFLEKPDPKYKECVRDIAYMRFHHMDLLKEIRVQAVRQGKRGDISLANCRGCHADRSRFCNRCHEAVNLHLDCFGCHNYPESAQETIRASASQSRMDAAMAGLSKPVP
jgi:hypothetical protein